MRRLLSALLMAFACVSFSPAQAGGLLQDLFAPAPRPAPTVHYYAPAQPQIRFLYDEGLRVSRRPSTSHKTIVKKAQNKRWAVSRKKSTTMAGARSSRRGFVHAGGWKKSHAVNARAKISRFVAASAPKAVPAVARAEAPAQIDNDPTLRIGDAYMTTEGLRIYRGPSAKAAKSKSFVEFRRSKIGSGVKSQLVALENAGRTDHARPIIPPALKLEPAHARNRKSVDRQGRVIRIVGP